MLKYIICITLCLVAFGCTPRSVETRLTKLEEQNRAYTTMEARLAHLEIRLQMLESTLGTTSQGKSDTPLTDVTDMNPLYEIKAVAVRPADQPAPAANLLDDTAGKTASKGEMAGAQASPTSGSDAAKRAIGVGDTQNMLADGSPSGAVMANTTPVMGSPTLAAASPNSLMDAPAPSKAPGSPMVSEYQAALTAYNAAKYTEAERAFETFLAKYPKDKLTPNARYWQGESMYGKGDFSGAVVVFKKLVAEFPQHDKAMDGLLKIGMCYAKLDDTANSKFYLEILVEDFPNSRAAGFAKRRLAAMPGD